MENPNIHDLLAGMVFAVFTITDYLEKSAVWELLEDEVKDSFHRFNQHCKDAKRKAAEEN